MCGNAVCLGLGHEHPSGLVETLRSGGLPKVRLEDAFFAIVSRETSISVQGES